MLNVLVSIIICMFTFYWVAIFEYMFFDDMSMNEAKKEVSKVVKNVIKISVTQLKDCYIALATWMKQQSAQKQYQVLIGYNNFCISGEIVNEYFEKLERYFEIWFYESYYCNDNLIVYQFKVFNLLNKDFPRARVLSICRHICEQALVRHWHELGDFTTHVDNFVAVTWQADTLRFHIAMNDNGINKIAELRKQSH